MIFWKYQGTGNDFIVMDNRSSEILLGASEIQSMCDRKFGVGADGVILIEKDNNTDFYMNFYNPDGSQSFCGNGSRCAVKFVLDQHIVLHEKITFQAIDGFHEARVTDKIEIKMKDVRSVTRKSDNRYFVNTGSPHVIELCDQLPMDIVFLGSSIRYSDEYAPDGTNVNFLVSNSKGEIAIRTYERGVENETLSCGTGVTASALVYASMHEDMSEIQVQTKGGLLWVTCEKQNDGFSNVWLKGPAEFVFKGEWNEK